MILQQRKAIIVQLKANSVVTWDGSTHVRSCPNNQYKVKLDIYNGMDSFGARNLLNCQLHRNAPYLLEF